MTCINDIWICLLGFHRYLRIYSNEKKIELIHEVNEQKKSITMEMGLMYSSNNFKSIFDIDESLN